jgi:membrane protein YdbS with pleckstrin-like domain
MNRARAPQVDHDPSGKRGEPNAAHVTINIVAIAAAMIMVLIWTFSWAQAWTALGVVFVAVVLMFIIPIVIFARSLEKDGPEHGGHGG